MNTHSAITKRHPDDESLAFTASTRASGITGQGTATALLRSSGAHQEPGPTRPRTQETARCPRP